MCLRLSAGHNLPFSSVAFSSSLFHFGYALARLSALSYTTRVYPLLGTNLCASQANIFSDKRFTCFFLTSLVFVLRSVLPSLLALSPMSGFLWAQRSEIVCAAFWFSFSPHYSVFGWWWLCRSVRRHFEARDTNLITTIIIICMFSSSFFSTCVLSFVCLFRWRRRRKEKITDDTFYGIFYVFTFLFFGFWTRKIIHVMMGKAKTLGTNRHWREKTKTERKRNEPNRMNVIQFQRWVAV